MEPRGRAVEERITLAAEPRSAGLARVFVSSALAEWGCEEIADPVILLTSELVTNAVIHAHSDIELVVDCDDDRVRVEVTDASEDQPVLRFPEPEDTSGRGLHLVDTMSSCWGVRHHPRNGKSIWFEISA